MTNLTPPQGMQQKRPRLRRLRKKKRRRSSSYLNQLLARIFVSFAVVWSFFTLKTKGPTLSEKEDSLFLRGGTKGNGNGHPTDSDSSTNKHKTGQDSNIEQRKDEVIGAGGKNQPTPPKAAFILVATHSLLDPIRSMSNAIESIFEHTDRDRILCILPIFRKSLLTKHGLDAVEVIEYFTELDLSGTIIHKHGDVKHVHKNNAGWNKKEIKMGDGKSFDETFVHGTTVKVIIENDGGSGEEHEHTQNKKETVNYTNTSVGESRRNAAKFVQLLHQEYMKQEQQPHKQEEVILTFLRPDSQIQNDDWLEIVADALAGSIPPPPLLNQNQKEEDLQSYHFNNAVSFALSQETRQQQHMADRKSLHHHHYHHHYSHDHLYHHNPKHKYTTTSLDINLQPIHTTTPLKSDITLTNGRSYPTPILEGSATSLLLSTYLSLPSFNQNLTSTVAADIELSLNLWLCGSGIDIITELQVEKDVMLLQSERDYVSYEEKVWLARDWMSDEITSVDNREGDAKTDSDKSTLLKSIGEKILWRLNNNTTDLLFKKGQNKVDMEEIETHHQKSLRNKLSECRTFDWFAKEVNIALGKQLHHFDQFIEEERIKAESQSIIKPEIV